MASGTTSITKKMSFEDLKDKGLTKDEVLQYLGDGKIVAEVAGKLLSMKSTNGTIGLSKDGKKICINGLRRFPISLYATEMEFILDHEPKIREQLVKVDRTRD